jgi:hypothetical protein
MVCSEVIGIGDNDNVRFDGVTVVLCRSLELRVADVTSVNRAEAHRNAESWSTADSRHSPTAMTIERAYSQTRKGNDPV